MLHNRSDGNSYVRVINLRIPLCEKNTEIMGAVDEFATVN